MPVIDPAHDFGKNAWHFAGAHPALGEMAATGRPVLLSASRKDFVGGPPGYIANRPGEGR